MQALIALTCAYKCKQSSNQSHSHIPNGRRERHVSQESLILLCTSDSMLVPDGSNIRSVSCAFAYSLAMETMDMNVNVEVELHFSVTSRLLLTASSDAH